MAPAEAQALVRHLRSSAIPWQQPQVRVYGKLHPVPRLVCWVGDPGCTYRYSGLVHAPLPWTTPLAALRAELQRRLGWEFNSLLLNRYRTGADRMGWHADDEPELEAGHPIASLSLGASRCLRFRPRPGGRPAPSLREEGGVAAPEPAGWGEESPFGLELADGDLLLMAPPTQRYWQHALPARLRLAGERINLTFRRIQAKP